MSGSGISDEQRLTEQLHNGDSAGMREFYSLHARYLAAVCARYVTDAEDMKDVFHDSLVAIFSRIADFSYRGPGSLRAWAARIVVNESLRFLNTSKRHEFSQLDREAAAITDNDDDEEENDNVLSADNVPPEIIHRLVSQLPTGYRTVFNLYVFEGRSHQEIAQLLGIKTKTSSSQLHRAKTLLAKMILQYHNQKQSPR